MGAESLMEDNKYLLECNFSNIVTTNGKQQEYWLLVSRLPERQVNCGSKQSSSNAVRDHRRQALILFLSTLWLQSLEQ